MGVAFCGNCLTEGGKLYSYRRKFLVCAECALKLINEKELKSEQEKESKAERNEKNLRAAKREESKSLRRITMDLRALPPDVHAISTNPSYDAVSKLSSPETLCSGLLTLKIRSGDY